MGSDSIPASPCYVVGCERWTHEECAYCREFVCPDHARIEDNRAVCADHVVHEKRAP